MTQLATPTARKLRRRPPLAFWIGAAGGLVAILLIIFLASRKGGPGFTVTLGGGGPTHWLMISNREKGDLEVRRILVNGEAEAKRGMYLSDGVAVWQPKLTMPAAIPIGDSMHFVYHQALSRKLEDDPLNLRSRGPRLDGEPYYPRDAVFIDFETNRGNWHYENGVLR